jgi:hypothetical protein
MGVRIRAAVHVHDCEEIGRPRWKSNPVIPGGRELFVSIRDLALVFSDPAARWLLSMLAAIMVMDEEPTGRCRSAARTSLDEPARDPLGMEIRVVVRVYRPGDVERPRWEGRELIVSARNLVLVLSEPAARCLLETLAAALGTNQSEI